MGEVVGKELQGDVATELEVFRFIHNTHAPAADPAEDAVMRNRLTHGLGGRGHRLGHVRGERGQGQLYGGAQGIQNADRNSSPAHLIFLAWISYSYRGDRYNQSHELERHRQT